MTAKKKILIVEDNLINREVLGSILSPVYEVLEAGNGEEGLAVLKEQKAGLSLILLDIVMPVMDGYAFLSRVKADAELALIPVVVTTQGSSEADEVAALSHGAATLCQSPTGQKSSCIGLRISLTCGKPQPWSANCNSTG